VPKIVAAPKGAWPGSISEVVRSRAFYLFFFSSFNAPTAYDEKRSLTLNAPKKRMMMMMMMMMVVVQRLANRFVPCESFFQRG